MVNWEGEGQNNGYKGVQENFWVNIYFHYLDCGEDFRDAYMVRICQILDFKYLQFITCQLNFSKAINIFSSQ